MAICKLCGKEFTPHTWASGQVSVYQCICDNCATYDKTERKKLCPACGKFFTETRKTIKDRWSGNKYCSITCADTIYRNVICPVCGKTFVSGVTREDKQKQKYCSIGCAEKINITKVCKSCGKDFITHPTLDGRNSKQYCDNCRPKEKRNKTNATCLAKYGVLYPCQTENCKESNYQAKSKINAEFCNLLAKNNLAYTTEVGIESKFYYDVQVDNTLIEINPTITHTCYSCISIFTPKDSCYHLNKTNAAVQNGYRCIHVWQWDDWDKIIDLIKPKQKLYARKLELKEIDKQEANQFLDQHHLQNSCRGNTVNLGLYQDNELVQIMTFGKPRYNKNYQYELLRLCTKVNYYVVGGAEKLFKHFIANYNPESVISYCDVSKFIGSVYSKLGFDLKEQTKPQKIWSKGTNYITDNLLRQRGADQLIGTHDGKGANNEDIMIREDWLPIYDCGQKVFEWKRGEFSQ